MFAFLILTLVGVLITCFILHHCFFKLPMCKSKTQLHGKTVIITGSNAGIGKHTALDLARRGARVILACRDQQRAEAAVADIKQMSGSNEVLYMHLDLAKLSSVRTFAESFLKREQRLDILINNAGIAIDGKTEEGFGIIFAVNHLGHFLLTHLLLDRLKECGPSRIVNVSSAGHRKGNIDFNCLSTHRDLLPAGYSGIDVLAVYCHSKLCNVLFTHELAKRLQGTDVTCYSLHPGVIGTGIARHGAALWHRLWQLLGVLFFASVEGGAQTTLHCALAEGIEPLSGRYFSRCGLDQPDPKGTDDAAAKKLWELSERFCGLS
ncbi:dehydrogenase/reductase SDR family member 13-like [Engraulis encrasicolus]|uniref:dehydrogenase/reductase SDR family member 13-like n=1 Tax=Engraulis encrasicolus TaxID=184585 RepID=UPI002FD32621